LHCLADTSHRRIDGSTTVSVRVAAVRTQRLFPVLEPLLPKTIAAKWRDYSERLRELLENQPLVPSKEAAGARAE